MENVDNFITVAMIVSAILGAIAGFMIAKSKIDEMHEVIKSYDVEREELAEKIKHFRGVLNDLSKELEGVKSDD